MKSKVTGENIIPVPTLSEQGFVYSTGDKLDRLLSYYFLSDANQSEIFKNEVVSFQHTFAAYQGRPMQLCENVKRELEGYLERFFNVVTVLVEYKDLKEGIDDGPYEIVLDVMAGDSFSDQQRLFKNVRMEDGLLTTILTYNNTGRLLKHDNILQKGQRRGRVQGTLARYEE